MKDPVVQAGDPVLRLIAGPVAKKDITSPKIAKIITRMKKVLHSEEYGVAIAAPQIGESLRIFVISGKVFVEEPKSPRQNDFEEEHSAKKKVLGSASPQPDHFFEQNTPPLPDRVFINPEITRRSRAKREMSEGCLSVRGKYGTVMRHEKASIKALDEHGKQIVYHGSGLVGHIFQHECDHLDGILYTDKALHLEEDEEMKSARVKLKEKHGL